MYIFAIMKISIEQYRGFDISFNPDKEEFNGLSDSYDSELSSKSFSAVKSKIDQYIKDNTTFRPFWVVDVSGYNKGEKLRVVGIRKDKRFMAEKSDGTKCQISDHNEKDYVEYKPEMDAIFEEIKKVGAKIGVLQKEKVAIEKTLTGKMLRDIKLERFNG